MYTIGSIPKTATENAAATAAAMRYAEHLQRMGAKIHWARGMQAYDPKSCWYIARADVVVIGPDGLLQQFGADQVFTEGTPEDAIVFPDPSDFGRLYRIGLWSNAAKAAIAPLLVKAFPKYQVTLGQELSVLAVYRNGLLMHSRYTLRRLRGFIDGFRAAYELTAPHPDKAQTSQELSAPTDPPPVQPE